MRVRTYIEVERVHIYVEMERVPIHIYICAKRVDMETELVRIKTEKRKRRTSDEKYS